MVGPHSSFRFAVEFTLNGRVVREAELAGDQVGPQIDDFLREHAGEQVSVFLFPLASLKTRWKR